MSFYFSYLGSKRLDIKFYKDFLVMPEHINIIVEPFCGSSATSYYMYKTLGFKKSYHINDIDVLLIKFINTVRKKGGIKYFMNKTKDATYNNKAEWLVHCNNPVYGYFYKQLVRAQHGMCPLPGRFKRNPSQNERLLAFDKFYLRNRLKVTNEDYKNIFKLYVNNKNAFIFLDPPYLDSNNLDYTTYAESGGFGICVDNTKIYIDILDFLKVAKCRVLLIINKLAIIELIFKDYVKGEYDKTYAATKKKTKHLIIANY